MESIVFRGVSPYGATGLTVNTYYIPHVFAHANLVEYLRQEVKHNLEPFQPRGFEKSITGIKVSHQMLDVSAESLKY